MRGCLVVVTMVVVVVLGALVAPGRALADSDPSFIEGTDGGADDRLVASAFRDLETFWEQRFGDISSGQALEPVAAYVSVDSGSATQQVPCLRSPAEIRGNAFYCPAADVIGYDRATLIPSLREDFGDDAVVVVMAHEFGHAIQQRLGLSIGDVPTILAEAQADCYGGLFLRQVREGGTENLSTDADGVDRAMAALVTFRDPVGTGAQDENAHGNAFDRVSSFQAGFDGDAATCADISLDNREFTQVEFASQQELATGGNLPVADLVEAMEPDLDRFFGDVVRARGAGWTAPEVSSSAATCTGAAEQGPVAVCLADGAAPTVGLDTDALAATHENIGDYASGTLLASRYATAALAALGEATEGEEAGRAAMCLAGAYTASAGDDQGFGLSPGDLDEAVAVLLSSESAATDTLGAPGAGTGYERVRVFRGGVDNGAESCLGA